MWLRHSTVLLAIGFGAWGPLRAAQAQLVRPRFEPADCPFEGGAWLERERIECGFLIVPERRDPPGERTLRIAVAVARSYGELPRSDPVVYLTGGPGHSTLRSVRSMISGPLWQSLRATRDLVFVDQRGTGYSEPAFCTELNEALRNVLYDGLEAPERRQRVRAAMAECRDRILAMGVDLGAYHSASSARDVADLRVALGYDEWNLFGVSYGTRLALVMMRDVPQGIRSVILSATIPPNAAEQPLTNYRRALQHVFEACAADRDCAAEYPDLERRFHAMLGQLESEPLMITVHDTATFPSDLLVVDGDLAAAGIFAALYSAAAIPYIPLITRVFESRRSDILRPMVGQIGDAQVSSRGLFLSVECYERAPYLTAEAAGADAAGAPGLARYGALVRPYLEDCDAWHGFRALPAELEAITSQIPTLILAGTFDPITPPAWGRLAASTLANSYYVEARTGGHGSPVDACTRSIMRAFIDKPNARPATACNAARVPVRFVTDVQLNGGVYRTLTALRALPGIGTAGWIGTTLLVLLSGVLAWPMGWLLRRRRDVRPRPSRTAAFARGVGGLGALAAVAFLVGLAWTVVWTTRTAPLTLTFGVPRSAKPLFFLPWAVLSLGLVSATLAAAAWRRGWWSAAARIHYTLVALACVSFVGFLVHWHLI